LQARVFEMQNAEDLLAGLVDQVGGAVGDGSFGLEGEWRVYEIRGANAQVIDELLHGGLEHGGVASDCSRAAGGVG
jgi:hypothetical protein